MLKPSLVRIGYVLGVSLLLASIIYFFAANWPGMARLEKTALAAGLVALFYGAAFALSRLRAMRGHRWFIGHLLVTAGCVSFGVAVLLLGQIYNSHADSWHLFLIWTVPALLFALISRFAPFDILAFVLGHLTLYFYFFPTLVRFEYSDAQQAGIFGLFAALNALLVALAERGRIKSDAVLIMAYLVFHFAVWMLSNSFVLGDLGIGLNALTAAVLAGCFYYYGRIRQNRLYLTLTALAFSAFLVLKFTELAEEHASSLFFFFGLMFVALLLSGNVLFFRYLQKMAPKPRDVSGDGQDETGQPQESGPQHQLTGPKPEEDRAGALAGRIVSAIVTVVGILIGTISLVGMVFMFNGDIDPENILFMLSLAFALPMLLIPRVNPVVRYTVLTIGYLGGLGSLIAIDKPVVSWLFVLAVIAGWIWLTGRVQRLFTYALMNANLMIALGQTTDGDHWTYIALTLAVLNGALHLFSPNPARFGDKSAALFFTLLFLFWLTFLESIFPYSREFFNLLFFVLATALVFFAARRERRAELKIALVFWFAFLFYKYYDLLWPLLHKSLTLAAAGLFTLGVTFAFSRKEGEAETPRQASFLQTKWPLVLLIVALQFGWLGLQTSVNEHLLRTGTLIKLELAPYDPRSMLQGDYVRLNYEISSPPEDELSRLREEGRSRVRVALVPGADGLHEFGRILAPGQQPNPGEVAINGVFDGWGSILYGIETYFIPEGTGTDVADASRYAFVRVGRNGNALIERLSEQ